jgi:curved DNA-binding protein CbpA
MRDLYAVLGVSRFAAIARIKEAYRAKAKEFHPDVGGDAEVFAALTAAYEILSDPDRRARYDRDGVVDGAPIDEATTKALGIIEQMLTQALAQLGADGKVYNDVVAKMREALADSRAALVTNMAEAKATASRIREFAKRFNIAEGKKNFLAGMLEFKAAQQDRRAAEMEKPLVWHDRAAEILADFSFEHDLEQVHQLSNGPFRSAWNGIG